MSEWQVVYKRWPLTEEGLSLGSNVSLCLQSLGYAMYNRPITTKLTVAGCLQVPELQGQGAPDVKHHANIPFKKLPHDSQGHLLRPGVVW